MTPLWIIAVATALHAWLTYTHTMRWDRGHKLNLKFLDLQEQDVAESHKRTYAEGVEAGRYLAKKEAEEAAKQCTQHVGEEK